MPIAVMVLGSVMLLRLEQPPKAAFPIRKIPFGSETIRNLSQFENISFGIRSTWLKSLLNIYELGMKQRSKNVPFLGNSKDSSFKQKENALSPINDMEFLLGIVTDTKS